MIREKIFAFVHMVIFVCCCYSNLIKPNKLMKKSCKCLKFEIH